MTLARRLCSTALRGFRTVGGPSPKSWPIQSLAHRARLFSSQSEDAPSVALTKEDNGVSIITLQRQETRNAISKRMVKEFNEVIDDIDGDKSVRVVILKSGVEKVFCAGADLKERATMPQEEVGAFVSSARAMITKLENIRVPTIAAIEGAALGGGLEIALACDFRVVGEKCLLGLPETALAIIPGAGGTQRLPRVVGPTKAKELIFTARRFGAEEAVRIGLATKSAPHGQAVEAAYELANEILPNGPVGVAMAKAAINWGMQQDMAGGLRVEEECYAQVIPTKDRLEGLQAFKEKRKPVYKGE